MIFFTALLALQVLTTQAQTSTLPIQGWAKNSVNAVVFRRNSVVTDANIQYTAYYNSEGYVVLGKRVLGSTTWETKITSYKGNVVDAHNSISIMVDGQGYLHMSWNHHNTALNYCKSAAPHTLTMDAAIPMIGTKETAVSYPEFHRLPNGDLIFMYRDGSSGNGNMVINKYDHLQKKWQRVHSALINGEGLRNAYWQSFIDIKGTIHVSWVWRESSDVASNHDLCYAQSTDGGHTWKKSSGSMYVIPITAATAEYAARIPQNSDLINQTSMYGDALGVPYICSYWKPAGTTTPQYHLVYLKNGLWHTQQISKRITPFSLSGSGTKKIPISRPQVLIGQVRDKIQAYVLYRDIEH
ncbi:MAG TPA: BNR repeat-containing protein, partial [Cytophagales bacterium]|nr:BNR repeat-containing protein [Cytophagales bacterium]